MTTEEHFAFLQHPMQGYISPKAIGDGMWAALHPFMFTCGIIVGEIGDISGYADRWCYETQAKAQAAFDVWDGSGEPEGWHRHPNSGRRRPGGDAEKEYVIP